MNISAPYRKKILRFISIFIICLIVSTFFINNKSNIIAHSSDEISEDDVKNCVNNLFLIRNKAILTKDLDSIHSLYDTDCNFGQWAYEYEEKKIKYINNWAEKQGVQFIDIIPNIIIKKTTPSKNKDRYSFYILCNTEYKYIYPDEPDKINSSRIGTYHSLTLKNVDNEWIVSKEWYTDPFADSLNLENIKADSIKEFIKSQGPRDFSNLNERRINAIKYAKMYCGAATAPEYEYKYNKNYRNFNCEGGDCANFASQILHEGGKFKETSAWNYDKGSASGPWINADKFTYYMLNSGRASVIAKGSYEKVYKASYKLLPGDFVAYEKKGDITHISTVSGADSKGYSLVTCHNTDRNDVPWDLGWSNKQIKFWLIHVNY